MCPMSADILCRVCSDVCCDGKDGLDSIIWDISCLLQFVVHCV